jgi:farnesol dehydrogenase
MRETVLVTGATGFIGRYVLRRLLAERPAATIRVLVRRPELLEPAARERVEVHVGDLCDGGAIERAVAGARRVLHLAALARAWDRKPSAFLDVNARAVARLLDACARWGTERLVHVSTVLAVPPNRPAPIGRRFLEPTPYERTKQEAERLVRSYVAAGGDAVIVRPTRVYGPGPLTDANGVTKLLSVYLRGRFRFRLADGDVLANYVHVDDVAAGILQAARSGQRGEAYFLGGENISLRGFLALASEISGVRRRLIALPAGPALAVAALAELWGRAGGTAFVTPGWVRIFLEDRAVDVEASRRAIGYAPRPLRNGLAETIAWLRATGRGGPAGDGR